MQGRRYTVQSYGGAAMKVRLGLHLFYILILVECRILTSKSFVTFHVVMKLCISVDCHVCINIKYFVELIELKVFLNIHTNAVMIGSIDLILLHLKLTKSCLDTLRINTNITALNTILPAVFKVFAK